MTRSRSPLVYQNSYSLTNLNFQFQVIRIWEQPKELFLSFPGLFPLATLSQSDNPEQVLAQVASLIDNIDNITDQKNIAAATGILAGLVLPANTINNILRRNVMRESVLYQSIRQEGINNTILAINLLKTGVSDEQIVNDTRLSLEQVQQLRSQLNS